MDYVHIHLIRTLTFMGGIAEAEIIGLFLTQIGKKVKFLVQVLSTKAEQDSG